MIFKIRKIFKNNIFYYMILSFLSTALNYLLQVYLGKKMSVSDYGSFTSVNAFCTNLVCFFSPISVYICREVAQKNGSIDDSKHEILDGLVFSVCISVILLLFLTFLFCFGYANRFGTDSWIHISIIVIILCAGGITYENGILQGSSKFVMLGGLTFLMIALKVAYVFFMPLEKGAIVPINAMLISNLVVVIIGAVFLWSVSSIQNNDYKVSFIDVHKKFLKLYSATFLLNTIISPYINGGEIVIMSGKYDLEEVGVYSLAMTIAKASVYVITVLTTVMLPKIAKENVNSRKTKELYFKSIGICFLIGLAWILFVRLIGTHMVLLLLGETYYMSLQNLKRMALWIINLGVLMMINTYYLAINRLKGYLIVLSSVSFVLYLLLKFCKIYFWNVPLVLGGATAIIIIWSIFDVLKENS